jgi:hypothetical protein
MDGEMVKNVGEEQLITAWEVSTDTLRMARKALEAKRSAERARQKTSTCQSAHDRNEARGLARKIEAKLVCKSAR